MPIYQIICDSCGNEEEHILKMDAENPRCSVCGSETHRGCGSCNFKLKYNPQTDCCSWANEGYASSMYWSEVKKQRAEGKKVKGCLEN
jgi:putative FmdB family regulatory protein